MSTTGGGALVYDDVFGTECSSEEPSSAVMKKKISTSSTRIIEAPRPLRRSSIDQTEDVLMKMCVRSRGEVDEKENSGDRQQQLSSTSFAPATTKRTQPKKMCSTSSSSSHDTEMLSFDSTNESESSSATTSSSCSPQATLSTESALNAFMRFLSLSDGGARSPLHDFGSSSSHFTTTTTTSVVTKNFTPPPTIDLCRFYYEDYATNYLVAEVKQSDFCVTPTGDSYKVDLKALELGCGVQRIKDFLEKWVFKNVSASPSENFFKAATRKTWIPRYMHLVGVSGCGAQLCVLQSCLRNDVNVIVVNDSFYVGNMYKQVYKLAKDHQPCVIFFRKAHNLLHDKRRSSELYQAHHSAKAEDVDVWLITHSESPLNSIPMEPAAITDVRRSSRRIPQRSASAGNVAKHLLLSRSRLASSSSASDLHRTRSSSSSSSEDGPSGEQFTYKIAPYFDKILEEAGVIRLVELPTEEERLSFVQHEIMRLSNTSSSRYEKSPTSAKKWDEFYQKIIYSSEHCSYLEIAQYLSRIFGIYKAEHGKSGGSAAAAASSVRHKEYFGELPSPEYLLDDLAECKRVITDSLRASSSVKRTICSDENPALREEEINSSYWSYIRTLKSTELCKYDREFLQSMPNLPEEHADEPEYDPYTEMDDYNNNSGGGGGEPRFSPQRVELRASPSLHCPSSPSSGGGRARERRLPSQRLAYGGGPGSSGYRNSGRGSSFGSGRSSHGDRHTSKRSRHHDSSSVRDHERYNSSLPEWANESNLHYDRRGGRTGGGSSSSYSSSSSTLRRHHQHSAEMTDIDLSHEDFSELRKSVSKLRAASRPSSGSKQQHHHHSSNQPEAVPYSPTSPAYHVP